MAGIFLNKNRLCSFLSFSSFFFFLLLNNYSAVSAAAVSPSLNGGGSSGYDLGYLSEQAKNLSDAFKSDYGLSSETKAKPAQSKKSIFADKQDKQNKQDKEESSTVKTKFFSLAPAYKKVLSSVSNIPRQTASVFSSILSPVGDFVSSLFINENISGVATGSYKVESSSSYKVGSSSSVIPLENGIHATSDKLDNPQLTNSTSSNANLDSRIHGNDRSVAPSVTRREVENLIKQSDDRNIALIRSIITAPSTVANSDSLSVQQSLANLSRRISVIQENNVRQLDHTYNSISRSFDDITSLDGVTMTNSSFSGTTGTFTGLLTGVAGTFSGDLTVSSELTVSGTGTSTFSGRLLATKAPTLAHSFSVWDTDTANSNVLDSSILINPSSATADSNLFGIAVNDNVKFLVDAEGDVFVRNLTATGTVNQANTSISTLTVENTAIFGDAVGDSITINAGTITSANPISWNLPNSQTSALNFESGLFNFDTSNSRIGIGTSSPYSMLSVAGQIVGENFVATSTTGISTFAGGLAVETSGLVYDYSTNRVGIGTAAPSYTLDVTGTAHALSGFYTDYGGTLLGNNLIGGSYGLYLNRDIWLNGSSLRATGSTGKISIGTTTPYSRLSVWGAGTGTSRLFELTDSASTTLVSFQENGTGYFLGNVGIGTTSPYAKLSVVGETVAEKFTATSTTATSTFNGDINFGITSNILQGGQRFLTSSTTAAGNLTIGYQSATGLDANGGLYNTGVGYQALGNATSTGYNTALGYQALKGSATISNAGYNTAVGYQALLNNTTGLYNTANGYQSLTSNTTGTYNTALGGYSLNSNTTGAANTANGYFSLQSNTTGTHNTSNGFYSLYSNTTGLYNTANGYQSLTSNTTGSYNVGNGVNALNANTTGTGNIANGLESLTSNTTGSYNVGLGYQSGYGDGTTQDQRSVIDNYATFIGYQASRSESVASTSALTNITAIGKNARVGRSNSIVLGGTGADAVNVGIGTTSPWARLSVSGDTALDSMFINFASSTAPSLTLNYLKSATSTIPSNTNYAWSIATSTTASPIFSISTLGSGANLNATTTINGGLNLDNGALLYDYSSGITTINSLEAGPMNFADDAGTVTWFDLAITSSSPLNTPHSYTAQIDSNDVLTIYSEADGAGVAKNLRVGIGTTTPLNSLTIHNATTTADADFGFTATSTGLASFYNWTMGIDISDAGKFKIASSTALGTNDRLVINGGGNIGTGGCADPDHIFEIGGTGTGCNTGAGSYLNAVGDLAFTANSSREWKQNIATYGRADILSRIKNAPVRTFDWKPEYCPDGNCLDKLGFIAEEFYGVLERGDDKHVNGQDVTMALWLGMQNFINVFDIASTATGTPALVIDALGNWKIGNDGALTVKEVRTEKLCVGSVCVTEEQFRSVFGQPLPTSHVGNGGSSSSASASSESSQSSSLNSSSSSSSSLDGSSSSATSSSSSSAQPTSHVGNGSSSSSTSSSESSSSSSETASSSSESSSSSLEAVSSSSSEASSETNSSSSSEASSSESSSSTSSSSDSSASSSSSSSAAEISSSSSESASSEASI